MLFVHLLQLEQRIAAPKMLRQWFIGLMFTLLDGLGA
jgi:hypothetical protein